MNKLQTQSLNFTLCFPKLLVFDSFGFDHASKCPFIGFVVTLCTWNHFDGVPRAMFCAEFAADAAIEIDFNQFAHVDVFRTRNNFDAIHRAKLNASFAARASRLIDDGERFGQFDFSWRLSCYGVVNFFSLFLRYVAVIEHAHSIALYGAFLELFH